MSDLLEGAVATVVVAGRDRLVTSVSSKRHKYVYWCSMSTSDMGMLGLTVDDISCAQTCTLLDGVLMQVVGLAFCSRTCDSE